MGLLQDVFSAVMFLVVVGIAAVFVSLILKWLVARPTPDPDECDVCGYDLRASKGRCPECGGEGRLRHARLKRLRDDWPADAITPRTPGPEETLVIVYQTDDGMLATLLAEHLEVRGITCHRADPQSIANLGVASVYGSYKLGVWSADAEEAKQVVARLLADPAAEERDQTQDLEAGEKVTAA